MPEDPMAFAPNSSSASSGGRAGVKSPPSLNGFSSKWPRLIVRAFPHRRETEHLVVILGIRRSVAHDHILLLFFGIVRRVEIELICCAL
jgi:hypothetical protein